MNWVKTFFWMVVLSILLVLVGSIFGKTGLIIGLGIALVTNGVAYFYGDKIALAAAQAREVGPAEAPELHRLADRLAAQYGVPKPRVYISPDPNPNAFATGRNPRHASIVVNEGLLRILDPEEVYGVLAHEFAHVRNRDILISSVVAVMAAAITFLAQMGFFFGGSRDENGGQNPLGLLGVLLILRKLGGQTSRTAILDTVVIFSGVALVQWVFFIDPYNHMRFGTEFARLVAMAYPAVDVLLLVAFALLAAGVDADSEIVRMGDFVPPMFTFRDPDGNRLVVVEQP